MQITHKYIYGAKWLNILYHYSGSSQYFTSANVMNNSAKNTFSMLYVLDDSYRINGNFEFLLEFPQLSGYNRWTQTANPITTFEGTSSSPVENGYQPVSISYTDSSWRGLMRSSSPSTFIDGSSNSDSWWYAIGSYVAHSGGIPGPGSVVNQVYFWVRIHDDPIMCSSAYSSIFMNASIKLMVIMILTMI